MPCPETDDFCDRCVTGVNGRLICSAHYCCAFTLYTASLNERESVHHPNEGQGNNNNNNKWLFMWFINTAANQIR